VEQGGRVRPGRPLPGAGGDGGPQALEGTDAVARKVMEEATEFSFAAKDHASGAADDRRVAEEAADLVYHLLVLLRERGVDPAAVIDVLAERAR
ncbi:phosphoribosyl-ATP diphosphatase, partial [bacterium]|nr:phosphoribosyl-ATP diphosphatase [bacterium]